MTITKRLYEAAQPVWREYLQHPFVTGIGDGSLSEDQFRYYLLQDYLYLIEYTRVFALGVVKAQDPEVMRMFSKSVNNILNGEMNIHRSYMLRLGITEQQVSEAKPTLTNLSYTNYMLSVSHSGSIADLVVSILACSWSYAEIAQALAQLPGAAEHPFFGEWIQGYTSPQYVASNEAIIALTDQLADQCTESAYQRMEEIFIACSRYELAFWEMSWKMES